MVHFICMWFIEHCCSSPKCQSNVQANKFTEVGNQPSSIFPYVNSLSPADLSSLDEGWHKSGTFRFWDWMNHVMAECWVTAMLSSICSNIGLVPFCLTKCRLPHLIVWRIRLYQPSSSVQCSERCAGPVPVFVLRVVGVVLALPLHPGAAVVAGVVALQLRHPATGLAPAPVM